MRGAFKCLLCACRQRAVAQRQQRDGHYGRLFAVCGASHDYPERLPCSQVVSYRWHGYTGAVGVRITALVSTKSSDSVEEALRRSRVHTVHLLRMCMARSSNPTLVICFTGRLWFSVKARSAWQTSSACCREHVQQATATAMQQSHELLAAISACRIFATADFCLSDKKGTMGCKHRHLHNSYTLGRMNGANMYAYRRDEVLVSHQVRWPNWRLFSVTTRLRHVRYIDRLIESPLC